MRERLLSVRGGAVSVLDSGGDGRPVVVHDGYGSRLVATLAAPPPAGVRLLAPDRPGFWRSTPQPGPPLAGWPGTLSTVLDALGVGRVSVLGVSAGTPFALAAAATLGDRITAVAVVGPFAPLDVSGDLRDMLGAQRRALLLARSLPRMGTLPVLALARLARRRPALAARLLASQRPAVDAERMRTGALRATLERLVPELFGDGHAARRELQAVVADWSDLLGRVDQPVRILAADADTVHPVSMGAALADGLPAATLEVRSGGLLDLLAEMPEVLAALCST